MKESRSARGAWKTYATGAMIGLDSTISLLPAAGPALASPQKVKLLPTPTARDSRVRDPKRTGGSSLTEVVRRILPGSPDRDEAP